MKEVIDRVPTRPNRIKLTSESDGSINYYAWERADEPITDGTPINKELFDSIGADITSLQQTTQKNTSDIATNKANIATNTSNIAKNTNDIDNVKFGESCSKNLVDWSKASHTIYDYGNGNIQTSSNYYGVLEHFETKGQKLTLSFDITSNVKEVWCAITLYDENKKYIRNVSGYAQELNVIPNSNEKYATFVLYSGNVITSKEDYYNVQLEYGDRTSYEPYLPSLKKLNSEVAKLKQPETVTLGTAWTQDSTNGYYTQTVALSGITSNDNPPIYVVLSGTLAEMQAQQEEWGKILKIETSTDTLKFYASEPTTVSLSVMVKGV